MRTVLLRVSGALFAALCAFFSYYTIRLIYINIFEPSVAGHRQTGMYVGAIVFPAAAFVFAWLSVRCFDLISRRIPPYSKR